MILQAITIVNYRSVDNISINLSTVGDSSFTYGLIGVNEAGKSTILKGIALPKNYALLNISLKDFKDKTIPIESRFMYEMNKSSREEFIVLLHAHTPIETIEEGDYFNFEIYYSFPYANPNSPEISVIFRNKKQTVNIPLNDKPDLLEFFNAKTHKTIFWTADEKHLITNSINLAAFASNPEKTSIPLKNCFKLAGITNIQECIDFLSDSTERESLRELLGSKVTEHIKRVWPKHPIKITFDISNGNIHFHVKDENVIGKSKTADQRSDGFRQFISFLLTLSAENINEELKNTIILLDEPETHLHPRAQEDLLKELIAITKGSNKNITFFATHSNYMIDKQNLSRNIKVAKLEDSTIIKKFTDKQSSYASVNYDVFDIPSTDYHNELFGRAQEICRIENGTDFDKKISEITNTEQNKSYTQSNGRKYDCTLPTYVRHQIHHPENNKNVRFTETELSTSISVLLDFLKKINVS